PRVSEMLHEDAAVEMTAVSIRPDKSALQSDALSWSAKARGLSIVDAQSCINASHLLKSIKGLRLEIQKWFEPHIEAAMETKRKAEAARKALVDEKDRMEAPLVVAEGITKRALLAWEDTQERLRREEEQRLQAEAQKQAEAMTLEAAAAMEMEAAVTGDAGLLQEAQEILAQPVEAPVVAVKTFMPKVSGVTYRDNWKAKDDIDVKALAAALAAGQVPTTFLAPNLTAINQYIRATQGTQPIPGVQIFNDRTIAARR
ncbi:MAG: hypothetical protein NUW01_18665, partial [Gemmatimonadaceae bacterium]|nr:hypothetical protein [Gemmatimonadaceae bacterium]